MRSGIDLETLLFSTVVSVTHRFLARDILENGGSIFLLSPMSFILVESSKR